MNITEIAERIAQIKATFPDADTYPIRFQGGQGSVCMVGVQSTGFGKDREIVFYTNRG